MSDVSYWWRPRATGDRLPVAGQNEASRRFFKVLSAMVGEHRSWGPWEIRADQSDALDALLAVTEGDLYAAVATLREAVQTYGDVVVEVHVTGDQGTMYLGGISGLETCRVKGATDA